MHTNNPPESGRARGDHSPHHGNDKNNDAQQIPDPAPNVNREIRELIRSKDEVLWFEVRGPRNRRRYEIIFEGRCLRYPLYYSASNKFDRLTKKGATTRAS